MSQTLRTTSAKLPRLIVMFVAMTFILNFAVPAARAEPPAPMGDRWHVGQYGLQASGAKDRICMPGFLPSGTAT